MVPFTAPDDPVRRRFAWRLGCGRCRKATSAARGPWRSGLGLTGRGAQPLDLAAQALVLVRKLQQHAPRKLAGAFRWSDRGLRHSVRFGPALGFRGWSRDPGADLGQGGALAPRDQPVEPGDNPGHQANLGANQRPAAGHAVRCSINPASLDPASLDPASLDPASLDPRWLSDRGLRILRQDQRLGLAGQGEGSRCRLGRGRFGHPGAARRGAGLRRGSLARGLARFGGPGRLRCGRLGRLAPLGLGRLAGFGGGCRGWPGAATGRGRRDQQILGRRRRSVRRDHRGSGYDHRPAMRRHTDISRKAGRRAGWTLDGRRFGGCHGGGARFGIVTAGDGPLAAAAPGMRIRHRDRPPTEIPISSVSWAGR